MGSMTHHKEKIVKFPNGQASVQRWYMNGSDEFMVSTRVKTQSAEALASGRRHCDMDAARHSDAID